MPKPSEAEITKLLTSQRLLRLATTREDGSPRLVPATYIYRDRTINLCARSQARWLADIRRDPRVCAVVDEQEWPLTKVTLQGSARIAHDLGQDDEWRELRTPALNPKWPGPTLHADGTEEWSMLEAYARMTYDEPRVHVVLPIDEFQMTAWRMPIVGEELSGVWSPRFAQRNWPRRFRVSEAGPRGPDWRVVSIPADQRELGTALE